MFMQRPADPDPDGMGKCFVVFTSVHWHISFSHPGRDQVRVLAAQQPIQLQQTLGGLSVR